MLSQKVAQLEDLIDFLNITNLQCRLSLEKAHSEEMTCINIENAKKYEVIEEKLEDVRKCLDLKNNPTGEIEILRKRDIEHELERALWKKKIEEKDIKLKEKDIRIKNITQAKKNLEKMH